MYPQILAIMLLTLMGSIQAIGLWGMRREEGERVSEGAYLLFGCGFLLWYFLLVFALHWGGFW